ncbi:hypothetical protein A3D00_03500 [Candidatus Woesebacteria bacterium RIFCSPHIGHO2_02_FULL_38_9]|uniref:2'-5' RNA ligase n=1 Tax=Candidatus Woesebacteria bacterium RIFCSPHIGHO2_01_FULL_39_28 TaxID=1802496 RepID=A0A1F7YGR3_9BACT|nr:MAG: hypothetical protein A2627_00755 [Candidatus Woesebacteria bacterium RIFCSPHIGHO2_01_FULL_39_28]OGM32563.1 MAG: hypothetical protein A3D00_03500 [Candidatus Woesebacteria bacterium RIFCSPHIGHO2_02_FULL_38_9]
MDNVTYLLIVVPPKEVIEYVDGLRGIYAKFTNYVIPPHVSIYPPFYSNFSSEFELVESLSGCFSHSSSFTVKMISVGYFEGKNNVAFLEPDGNSSKYLLKLLTKAVSCFGRNVKNTFSDYSFTPEKFKPHMTIAEKIPKEELSRLKKELSKEKVDESFEVNSVYLYRQSKGTSIWQERAKINFTS